jgi:glycine cleavage system H protein
MAEYRGCILPESLYYDGDYVWLRPVGDGLVAIGVTDPAQTMGGRILAAHIKKPGTQIRAGRHVATLESGKWVGGIPVPLRFWSSAMRRCLPIRTWSMSTRTAKAGSRGCALMISALRWLALRQASPQSPRCGNGLTVTTLNACAAPIRSRFARRARPCTALVRLPSATLRLLRRLLVRCLNERLETNRRGASACWSCDLDFCPDN